MDRVSIPLSLTNRTIQLGGREQLVSERRLNLSTCGGGASGATSRFAVLPAALPPLEAARLLSEASTRAFDTRPDSVDREPAHELYLVRDGVVQPDAHGLHELTKPSVAWLTQLVNQLHPELCAGNPHPHPHSHPHPHPHPHPNRRSRPWRRIASRPSAATCSCT